jgi:hypothetical protein
MTRYSIFVREYGSDHDVELLKVNSKPQDIVDGLKEKTLTIKRSIFKKGPRVLKIQKYTNIRVVDHEGGQGHG